MLPHMPRNPLTRWFITLAPFERWQREEEIEPALLTGGTYGFCYFIRDDGQEWRQLYAVPTRRKLYIVTPLGYVKAKSGDIFPTVKRTQFRLPWNEFRRVAHRGDTLICESADPQEINGFEVLVIEVKDKGVAHNWLNHFARHGVEVHDADDPDWIASPTPSV